MPDDLDWTPESNPAPTAVPGEGQAQLPFDPGELPVGFDPLIVNPIIATGETGAIERPGDDRPAWVIGIFFAAFCALISGLVTVALTRDDPDVARPQPAAESVEPDQGQSDVPTPSIDAPTPPVAELDSGTDAVADLEASTSAPAGEVIETVDDPRLPAVGQASISGVAYDLEAGCATHLPLAPNDADAQVSTYFFRDADGEQRVIDRRFGDRDDVAAEFLGFRGEVVGVEDLGGSGAFIASFVGSDGATVEVAVNPGADDGDDCADSLVTNEPGQFAFPYTRIVMFVCADGSQGSDLYAAGTTSEGGRFSARANGDDTVTLTYRNPALGVDYVDPTAFSFESDGRLGYSGVVSNGVDSLDITVDFSTGRAGPCTAADLV